MSKLARSTLVALGIGLLALVGPHRNPWDPTWVSLVSASAGVGMRTLALGLLVVLLASTGALALVPTAARTALDRKSLGVAPGVGCLLTLTLVSATDRGAAVVLALLLGTLGVGLVTVGLDRGSVFERVAVAEDRFARKLARIPSAWLVAGAALFVLSCSAAACHFLLGRIPHVVDAAAQLFHAKILLAGHVWAPAPEPYEPFRFTHMVVTGGRWYSQYPPGHVLLLAAGLLARAPWLVNPLLGAATAVLVYLLARETHDEATARIAAVLWSLSPFVWITSASFMNHAPASFFLALFLWGFARALGRGGVPSAVLAGLACGCAMNVRPLTAAAFAAPCALWAIARTLMAAAQGEPGSAVHLLRRGAAMVAALGLPIAALFAFNAATTGDPFVFGYEAAHGREALPGLGASGFWDRPHGAGQGLAATLDNLNAANQYLFGLPLPSLALPLAGLAFGRRRGWDRLLAACAAALILAYFFYWYHDWTYGPRFLYEATVPLVVLSAVAVRGLHAGLLSGSARVRRISARSTVALLVSLFYGWVVVVPGLASFYGRNYADGNAAVVRAVDEAALAGAVLLVPGIYYVSLFPRNDPTLAGPVIYARDEGPGPARALAARFPGRKFYRLRALERYGVEPYEPLADTGTVSFELQPGTRFVVEALSFQVSHLRAERVANRPTAALGGGWLNHDELRVASDGPGAEVGFVFESKHPESRDLVLALTRSPASGSVEVFWNGRALGPPIDLWAARERPATFRFDGIGLAAGRNGLLLRVVGRNQAARGHELGVDFVRFE